MLSEPDPSPPESGNPNLATSGAHLATTSVTSNPEDSEWKTVDRTKQRATETGNHSKNQVSEAQNPQKALNSYITRLREDTISFLISNFSTNWTKQEMKPFFSKFGTVRDIHIPKSLDKTGRRFMFVRFVPTVEILQLEDKLNGLEVGSYRLRARMVKSKFSEGSNVADPMSPPAKSALPRIHFEPQPAEWLKTCLIGELRRSISPEQTTEALQTAGYSDISLIRLVGGEFLLRFESEKRKEQFLVEEELWASAGIQKLRDGRSSKSSGRAVWLRVHGTPLHCWETRFFLAVATLFGRGVKVASCTSERQNLQHGLVLVVTDSADRISSTVEVEIGGELVQIFVEENVIRQNQWKTGGIVANYTTETSTSAVIELFNTAEFPALSTRATKDVVVNQVQMDSDGTADDSSSKRGRLKAEERDNLSAGISARRTAAAELQSEMDGKVNLGSKHIERDVGKLGQDSGSGPEVMDKAYQLNLSEKPTVGPPVGEPDLYGLPDLQVNSPQSHRRFVTLSRNQGQFSALLASQHVSTTMLGSGSCYKAQNILAGFADSK